MAQQPFESIQPFIGGVCDIKGKPLLLAPQLEDIDLLQTIRRKSKLPNDPEVIIILNVDCLKREEVQLRVNPKNNMLSLTAEHGDRLDKRNRSFSRSLNYEWYLPQKVSCNTLQAQWTEDDYLIITSTKSEVNSVAEGSMELIPQRTGKVLRPPVDLSAMMDIIKDLRDKSECALRFVRMRVGDVGSPSNGPSPPDKPDDQPSTADVTSNA